MGKGIINYDAEETNRLLAFIKEILDGGGINLDAPKDGNIYGQKDGEWAKAQEQLESGKNIKTLNGVSVLGEGNIDIAPTIGENGNWYINGLDTGKPANGKDGADGVSLGEIALVQETGTGTGSENKVMSQAAVTRELTELAKFTYTNSEKGNYFIKELFFSEKFITEKNWENIYLYQVRRNQDGNWMLIFSDDKVGTNSFALQIKEELSFLYNEFVYAIVNWNTYEQGTHFETDKIKINKEISFDSSFSPVINSFINYINSSQLATITGDSKTKAASQFLVKQETEKLLPTLNYFSVSDDAYEASTFLKEIYLSEKFLESKAWNDLYIYQRRKNVSGTYNIILSSDISATDSFGLNSLSEDNTLLGNEQLDAYAVVNWDVIKTEGTDFKVLHLDINRAKKIQYAPYICNYISSKKIVLEPSVKNMNTQTNTDFSNLLKTIGKTPMLTWVDDDGVYDGVEKIRPVFEELGIPMTFGLIPPLSDIAHDAVTRKEYFLDLQKDGHHCTTHPKHDKWYGEIDIKTVESSLIDCMVELQSSGFLHSDYLIYPGYGDSYEEIREIVKKWCKAGVTAGYNETLNHLGDSTKWRIKRCFIEFSSERTVEWYKSLVDKCYSDGDWLIFGTHSNGFDSSTDTADITANNIGNLKTLWQYAISLHIKIYTLHDAYSRREFLFTFNEINL